MYHSNTSKDISIHLYTDGGACPKEKFGSWAFCLTENPQRKISSGTGNGTKENTTCNRMELTAVINGLIFFLKSKYTPKYKRIQIYTDSRYVVDSFYYNSVNQWEQNNWLTSHGIEIPNKDLWIEIHDIMQIAKHKGYIIEFNWIKGHNGNYFNELVDEICTKSLKERLLTS